MIDVLSISNAESFDHTQTGGCQLRWWFERVQGLRPEQDTAQSDGEKGHALLAEYFRTGASPKGRVKMGKAVTAAILKGELPNPGPDMLVESRFDGRPQRDAEGNWIPVDRDKTLWIGGVPWDGFVDLRFRRDGLVHVIDHKFSSDPLTYGKKSSDLINTIQLPVYVLDSLRIWPDAKTFRISHHYVAKTGTLSFFRDAVVGLDEVLERKSAIEALVPQMQSIAQVTNQRDVPFNRKSCSAWRGCPHQSICHAFKENKMALSAEEMALFGELDNLPPVAPPPVSREPGEDDVSEEERAEEEGYVLAPAEIAARESDASKAERSDRERGRDAAFEAGALSEIPEPVASVPAEPAPACDACGTELTPENGSRLTSGVWKHIGCPIEATPVEQLKKRKREKKADAGKGADATAAVQGIVEGMEAAFKAAATAPVLDFALHQGGLHRVTESIRASSVTPEQVPPPVAASRLPTPGAGLTVTVRVELGDRTLAILERILSR